MQRPLFRIVTVLVLLGLFLTACALSPAEIPDSQSAGSQLATDAGAPSDDTASPDAQIPADGAQHAPLDSSAIQPQPSNTPDNRLPPERWQEWPVVPEVPGTAIQIYQQGMARGSNSSAFSKVGDCQSISEVMMGIYDIPGRYTLRGEDAYLQETIEKFKGSFNRDGNAVKGGFNAASVLSPLWADPVQCLPGESPLECELRAHNPSIIIISLEVWWEGRTVERMKPTCARSSRLPLPMALFPCSQPKLTMSRAITVSITPPPGWLMNMIFPVEFLAGGSASGFQGFGSCS